MAYPRRDLGALVVLVALEHDLDPQALACGLEGLHSLLQGEAVSHQRLNVHLLRRQHRYRHGPAGGVRERVEELLIHCSFSH